MYIQSVSYTQRYTCCFLSHFTPTYDGLKFVGTVKNTQCTAYSNVNIDVQYYISIHRLVKIWKKQVSKISIDLFSSEESRQFEFVDILLSKLHLRQHYFEVIYVLVWISARVSARWNIFPCGELESLLSVLWKASQELAVCCQLAVQSAHLEDGNLLSEAV